MVATPTKQAVRIARVIARLNVGGPAQHVVWLSAGLPEHEFQTRLITGNVPAGEEDMSQFARMLGVEPLVLPRLSREISPADLLVTWQLYRRFIHDRPLIVHTHTAKAGFVGRVAAFLYRWFTPSTLLGRPRPVKLVHTFHGHIFHSYYGRITTAFFRALERVLAIWTDRIVVLSEQQREEICDRFRIGRPKQFQVIPLGLDLEGVAPSADERQRLRGELGVDPDAMLVGIVGRLAPVKNHELFLDFSRIAAQRNRECAFVVFGDGAERLRLEQRARELTIPVIFAGTRKAKAIYSALDVTVLTSRNEGTPLALIESMAAGKPVISTAVGGVVDLLGPIVEKRHSFDIRERGLSVASGDAEGLAAALGRLLADEALRDGTVSRGRAHAFAIHSKERLLADILALYRSLL